jgi:hypothetical protein
MEKGKASLILGDVLAIAIVTVVGIVTHRESGLEYLPLAFFPLVIIWLILAPWFDLFSLQVVSGLKTIWRPALAALFAAPLALVFCGLILNALLPIFAVVFTLTSAFGLVVWRPIYFLFIKK